MILYESYYGVTPLGSDSIQHYGSKGMKWHHRRWQNPDGSYTAAGRVHYGIGEARDKAESDSKKNSQPDASKLGANVKGGDASKKKALNKQQREKKIEKEQANLENAATYWGRSSASAKDIARGEALENKIAQLHDAAINGSAKSKSLNKSWQKIRDLNNEYGDRVNEYAAEHPMPKWKPGLFGRDKKYPNALNDWRAERNNDPKLKDIVSRQQKEVSNYYGHMLKAMGYEDDERNRKSLARILTEHR